MPSDSLSSLQLQIVQRCDDHEQREKSEILQPLHSLRELLHQIWQTSVHVPRIHDATVNLQSRGGRHEPPRIPKVYNYFTPENCMAYLVMEYIQASPTPTQDAPKKVADALQWLRRLPAPPGATYTLFKVFESPFSFSGIEALERYLNEVRLCLSLFSSHSPHAYHGLN